MSYRVWVKCKNCGNENFFPTILNKKSNECDTCPGCKSTWQESQIVAKVNFSQKSADHVIWI